MSRYRKTGLTPLQYKHQACNTLIKPVIKVASLQYKYQAWNGNIRPATQISSVQYNHQTCDNQSASMAGAVRVEVNQPETSATCAFFYNKCMTRKCLTLKMKVNVTEYTKSQWSHSIANINLYKSRTWAFFASSHRFPDVIYYIFPEMLWPWKYKLRSRFTTFAMAPFDG